jgi:hypothetical protein
MPPLAHGRPCLFGPAPGQSVTAVFTIRRRARYVWIMILLLAAAASLAPSAPVRPERQAQAMVRILVAAELRFAAIERTDPKSLRSTTLRASDGAVETARLVEFQ